MWESRVAGRVIQRVGAEMPIETVSRAIQRAAVDPAAWAEVQACCEAFLGAFASQLVRVDHMNGSGSWCRTSHCMDEDDYFAEIIRNSEHARFARANPHWRRFTDRDVITPEEIERSEFYAISRRYDVGWRLGLRLVDEPDVSKAVVFLWRPQEGHVGQVEIDRLGLIERQLRLAAFVANQLPGGIVGHGHLLDGLERAERAALVATPLGAVLHANARAEAMLAAGDGLALVRGRLMAARPARDALGRALAAAGGAGGGTVAVPRPSGRAPWLVTAAPLAAAVGFPGPPEPRVLVLIRDPEAREMPEGAVLIRAFGLTPAEAAVCRRFATGKTLPEIADARGVSEGSTRQQLKAAMGKLGVGRQAELMRLLRALPGDGHIPDGR